MRKKRKEKETTEEVELILKKEPKQQKTTKDRGLASSMESKEAEHLADVRHLTWNPKLKLDGVVLS